MMLLFLLRAESDENYYINMEQYDTRFFNRPIIYIHRIYRGKKN